MADHHPGPWKWRANGEPYIGGEDIYITDATEDPDIAMVWAWFDEDGIRGPLSVQSQANAHLIAAAPDLLAALEEWFIDYDGWSPSELQKRYRPDMIAKVERTRAAIEKAKGSYNQSENGDV
jgi:hypothetical protein